MKKWEVRRAITQYYIEKNVFAAEVLENIPEKVPASGTAQLELEKLRLEHEIKLKQMRKSRERERERERAEKVRERERERADKQREHARQLKELEVKRDQELQLRALEVKRGQERAEKQREHELQLKKLEAAEREREAERQRKHDLEMEKLKQEQSGQGSDREERFDVSRALRVCKPSAFYKLPPGPTPLPLIGNLHTLDLKMLYQSLTELSEQYGPVFTIQLGVEKAVVLTGYKAVTEALVDQADEFAERAEIPVLEMQANGYGISFGHGESWRQMRRFTLTTLRNFGMGKRTIEDKITEEAKYLVREVEAHQGWSLTSVHSSTLAGQPFSTTVPVTSAMANIICSIVFGERFDYNDEIFLTITKLIRENFNLLGSSRVQMYNAFPFLGFLPGTHKKIFQNRTQMVQLIQNFYREHQKTLNENNIRSLIDAFLVKREEELNNADSYFHDNNLVTSVTNLFAAGTDTSSSTLRWAILLMMKYPQIQRNVQEEINRVIGTERAPQMMDRKAMPYTDAVLHEIQRFANIIPMNMPHATTKDTHFREYFIPKGMQIIPLLSSVLRDKTQWETPDDFNPSHFLDAEGRFVKRDAFIPFSAGRRICIGESLAKMELFLFFTTLMQRFSFHAVPGTSLDLTPSVGFTLCPKPHLVCAALRYRIRYNYGHSEDPKEIRTRAMGNSRKPMDSRRNLPGVELGFRKGVRVRAERSGLPEFGFGQSAAGSRSSGSGRAQRAPGVRVRAERSGLPEFGFGQSAAGSRSSGSGRAQRAPGVRVRAERSGLPEFGFGQSAAGSRSSGSGRAQRAPGVRVPAERSGLPEFGFGQSAAGSRSSGSGRAQRAPGVRVPAERSGLPEFGFGQSAAGSRSSGSGRAQRAPGVRVPAERSGLPEFGFRQSAAGSRSSGSGRAQRAPGVRVPAERSGLPEFGFRQSAAGSRSSGSGRAQRAPGVRVPAERSGLPEFGFRQSAAGSRSSGSGRAQRAPGVRVPAERSGLPEFGFRQSAAGSRSSAPLEPASVLHLGSSPVTPLQQNELAKNEPSVHRPRATCPRQPGLPTGLHDQLLREVMESLRSLSENVKKVSEQADRVLAATVNYHQRSLSLFVLMDSGAEGNLLDEVIASRAGTPMETRALDGKPLAPVTHYDISIFSSSLQNHIHHVRQVLQRLWENKLFVKAVKCIPSVSFLGYIIESGQERADPEKIQVVEEWPRPNDPQVWRAFCQVLGASISISTGFHRQTNGQTERVNQDLEVALRCIPTDNPSTWSDHLVWVEKLEPPPGSDSPAGPAQRRQRIGRGRTPAGQRQSGRIRPAEATVGSWVQGEQQNYSDPPGTLVKSTESAGKMNKTGRRGLRTREEQEQHDEPGKTGSLEKAVSPREPEMSFDGVYSLDAVTLVLLCVVTALFLVYFRNGSKSHVELNFPPGPTPLPIIGNLHLLDLKKPDQSLMELSEKYGPIFSIKLGTKRVVVLTGYETVKEALINHPDQFAGRPHIPIIHDVTQCVGIFFGNGESWRQMRRFTMSTLRDFGMGKKTIEDKITEEADFLIKLFESHKGQEFNPAIQINAAVGNIICSIVFGDRFDYDDQAFIILIKTVNENVQLAGSPMVQLYNAFPILGFLPGSHKKMCKNQTLLWQFIKDFITKNYQTLNANDPRSFIDAFMLKQQQESGNPNTYFHENNLIGTVADLFGAGTETTSTTLRWAMLLMMKYPQIQEKVHDEITTVIGSERFPRSEDRKKLPYTDAVIHEIQRFANIVPLNIMHSTTEDVNFKGYFLPKGTPVVPLLTSVLYDKTQWESPNDFNPSNFLDADGKFVKRDAFAPFSMGRRACAGETLARMELFLFFTILIQRFRFQVPPNVTNLELTSGVGSISCPKYQNVCAVRR
ncbi:uncharacterized protein LOC132398969 [Hypanus sabinus]|uniref:uncharacterized protein LOC132398969 n=1 Tax=Hypanus sabinus TaxID=79690 RepID=UPI0028C4CB6F|nr:uncharacterized protein LOC132398969 [Hypanus sabinus]